MARRKLPVGELTVAIDSLSHDGRGVAHVEGKAVFLPGALPGEQVSFKYRRRQRRYDEGQVTAIVTPSADRVEPRCPHAGLCGGCVLQHLHPERQIAFKEGQLREAMQRIGKVQPAFWWPPHAVQSWGYRRKARLGGKYVAAKGKTLVGFREQSSAYIADIDECPVLDPRVGERLRQLKTVVDGLELRDAIPQIEVALGDEQGILVFRVLSTPGLADQAALRQLGVDLDLDIWLQQGGVDTLKPLTPETTRPLEYALPEFEVRLRFEPLDFTQVNAAMNREMVSLALQHLAPTVEDRVLDLFCGLGNFTLPLARRAGAVVGVEGDAGLVARARANAERHGMGHVEFFTTDLFCVTEHEPWMRQTYPLALLDPPRTGAQELLPWLPRLGVRRLLYVSCNPSTLARDAGLLVHEQGYRLCAAGVMDMFPHTAHVESMALFERC